MPQIKIKQHDIKDCVAACLASVAAHYQLQLPLARISQYSGADKKGTNLLGLLEAAEKLGFEAKGVKGELEHLYKIPLPAIAHVVLKNSLHHYEVIYSVTAKKVEVMDPGDGEMHSYTPEEFQEIWSGAILLLLPKEDFVTGNEKFSISSRFRVLLLPHGWGFVPMFYWCYCHHPLGSCPCPLHSKTYRFCTTYWERASAQLIELCHGGVAYFSSDHWGVQGCIHHKSWTTNRC